MFDFQILTSVRVAHAKMEARAETTSIPSPAFASRASRGSAVTEVSLLGKAREGASKDLKRAGRLDVKGFPSSDANDNLSALKALGKIRIITI